MVKHLAAKFIGLFMVALAFASANAAPLGFNGAYDYSTFTGTPTYADDPQVYTAIDATQQTLTLYEPNSVPQVTYGPQEFRFSHDVLAAGLVSFDFEFQPASDNCCAGLNFYVNNQLYNLTGGFFDDPFRAIGNLNGSFSVGVNAGDTIAFGAFSADGCCGPTSLSVSTITNFDVTARVAAVPEPAPLALIGLGLLGAAVARRRRR
jgi:hypothetical protein